MNISQVYSSIIYILFVVRSIYTSIRSRIKGEQSHPIVFFSSFFFTTTSPSSSLLPLSQSMSLLCGENRTILLQFATKTLFKSIFFELVCPFYDTKNTLGNLIILRSILKWKIAFENSEQRMYWLFPFKEKFIFASRL